jgi:hypothetical protein
MSSSFSTTRTRRVSLTMSITAGPCVESLGRGDQRTPAVLKIGVSWNSWTSRGSLFPETHFDSFVSTSKDASGAY